MAATITRALTLNRLSAACCCRQSIFKQALSTIDADSNVGADISEAEYLEELQRLEEEKLCDISGLTNRQKQRMYGQVPEARNEYDRSVRAHRKLYGKLGSASGIDPRLSWTGRQKAQELAQLYRQYNPPLEEKLAKLTAQKQEEEEKALLREQKIVANMAKMDQWVSEYRQRQAQKDEEVRKKEQKKQQLLEEAREYFGYYVDPRDAKFQAMLEEKELRAKALAKKQKKEKRLAKLTAKLQSMAAGNEQK